MGDRKSESGSGMTSEYNNLYGSGRLKARKYKTYGLDYPYKWRSGEVCVEDGETVTRMINSGNAALFVVSATDRWERV